MKVLDLFSGIGGFTLGLDSTGFFKTVKFVEKDKYCQKVLRKNFPNIPIEEDIKNVKGKEGDADVIVGGFPCQPMSVAGKRKIDGIIIFKMILLGLKEQMLEVNLVG